MLRDILIRVYLGLILQIVAFKVEVFIVLHEAAANRSTIHVWALNKMKCSENRCAKRLIILYTHLQQPTEEQGQAQPQCFILYILVGLDELGGIVFHRPDIIG